MDGSLLDQQAAVVGFLVAFLLAVLLTPVVSQAAWRAGIVDTPTEERRLHALPDVDASFEQRLQQPPGAAAFAHVQRRGRMAAGGIGAMLLLQIVLAFIGMMLLR